MAMLFLIKLLEIMKNNYNEMYTDHVAVREIYGRYSHWMKVKFVATTD
jgi:hypothetical protein